MVLANIWIKSALKKNLAVSNFDSFQFELLFQIRFGENILIFLINVPTLI